MRGIKLSNEYQRLFGRLYANTPKSVFAALLASYMIRCEIPAEQLQAEAIREWDTLHSNGIVQQKAPQPL